MDKTVGMDKPAIISKRSHSPARVFYEFLRSRLLGSYFGILKIFLLEYVPVSYSRTSAVNVALSTDDLIPEVPVMKDYMDIFYFPVFLIARANIGRSADPEIEERLRQATTTLADTYKKTCSVYRVRQSSFRKGQAKSVSIKLLRLFDRNRNCYPSLHAQVIAQLYNTFLDHEKVVGKQELLDSATRILEACFLVKQHSIRDIAAGLGGVTVLDPSFTRERAKELIDNIFTRNTHGMSDVVRDTIRGTMIDVYDRVLRDSESMPYDKIFIHHLRDNTSD